MTQPNNDIDIDIDADVELTPAFERDALEAAKEFGAAKASDMVCAEHAEIHLQPWDDERLKEIAGWEPDAAYKPFFRHPPEPPTEDHYWFFQEDVFPAFTDAFYDGCADPEQCEVCR